MVNNNEICLLSLRIKVNLQYSISKKIIHYKMRPSILRKFMKDEYSVMVVQDLVFNGSDYVIKKIPIYDCKMRYMNYVFTKKTLQISYICV